MSRYRRIHYDGGTYFFTVVTYRRRPMFADDSARRILGCSFREAQKARPFDMVALCLLPDHFHCIWQLPEGDKDFSTRMSHVKATFTRHYLANGGVEGVRCVSRKRTREAAVWQRRFRDHAIRDDEDFRRHVDYIHYNPVKHGLATRPADWEWSTFRKYVKQGVYDDTWGEMPPEWPEGFGDAFE